MGTEASTVQRMGICQHSLVDQLERILALVIAAHSFFSSSPNYLPNILVKTPTLPATNKCSNTDQLFKTTF